MTLYDVTLTMRPNLATYPGEPGPRLHALRRIAAGDVANVSELRLGVHSGTHIDAPVHFLEGREGIDRLPLEILVGPSVVVGAMTARAITAELLGNQQRLAGVERVLFKTRNGAFADDASFHPEFTYIAPDGARWLVDHGVRLVGIDYLSVEQYGAPEPLTHRILLGADVVVIEGLDLRSVEPGHYTLIALPVKLADADGAPARVLLSD